MDETSLPPDLRRESADVYYAGGAVRRADAATVDFLKREAAAAPRRRCRLCLHAAPAARQHEMLIVMHRDSQVVPHSHAGKDETMLVLEGKALAPTFDQHGGITDVIEMGAPGSGRTFLYHMPEGVIHGVLIESEWLVYVETTLGPFRREATLFPTWAPADVDNRAVADFQAGMLRAIRDWQSRAPRTLR